MSFCRAAPRSRSSVIYMRFKPLGSHTKNVIGKRRLIVLPVLSRVIANIDMFGMPFGAKIDSTLVTLRRRRRRDVRNRALLN